MRSGELEDGYVGAPTHHMLYITVLGTPLRQYKSDFAVIVFVAKFSIWGNVIYYSA